MRHLPQLFYDWYSTNKRDLPWRSNPEPYLVWISEIILQQTRVSQGLPYYHRFVKRFPDVKTLATAKQDELMKVWEGLGYYSRALHMHEAAMQIVNEHDGIFPAAYQSLLKLKGVGEYTASAVASIAFGLPHAVSDGNVMRFLARFFGMEESIDSVSGKKAFLQKAQEILDTEQPGTHNQAVMEFGALVCLPGKPDCPHCPLSPDCYAYQQGRVDHFPVRSRKKERRTRYFYFFVCRIKDDLLIGKRNTLDIWKNLYQFPLLESTGALSDEEIVTHPFCLKLMSDDSTLEGISGIYNHDLTHQRIVARFITIHKKSAYGMNDDYFEANIKEIHKFAFPVLINKYIAVLTNH